METLYVVWWLNEVSQWLFALMFGVGASAQIDILNQKMDIVADQLDKFLELSKL